MVPGVTAGKLAEYQLWKVCRGAEPIRTAANWEVLAEMPGLMYFGRSERFDRSARKRAGFVEGSVIPEGLLESLPPDQSRDFLAYPLTLK